MGGGGATPWYLAGGVPLVNCVAAYQPIGAADLASSYINLANPGTYDAAPGTAPSFAAATGWTFNGTDQYLNSGVVPSLNPNSWSALVRFSDYGASVRWLFGIKQSESPWGSFAIKCSTSAHTCIYAKADAESPQAPEILSGVLGMNATKGFRNGVYDRDLIVSTVANANPIYIGAACKLDNTPIYFLNGKIQALAIYSIGITDAQMTAISIAMAAL